jgi:REP element-mobilizing transposase RayT
MELILWSALGTAQNLHPLKIISFVVMGNHIHLIALVEDPTTVESFMERFKCETAHAINRLLGRRQVTVWCEGYDSPTILTLDDLVEKLAYVYANPVRAHMTNSISSYQGVSSWGMFSAGENSREVKRIRRNLLSPIPTARRSAAEWAREAYSLARLSTEVLTFELTPDAWIIAFPNQSTPERVRERLINRIREIESQMAEMREREGIKLPSNDEVTTKPIDTTYNPKKFGRRMWCICGDIPLRIAFISFIKNLRSKARQVRLKWLSGDLGEPFPTGLFPPSQPMLANLLPGYFKRAISVT